MSKEKSKSMDTILSRIAMDKDLSCSLKKILHCIKFYEVLEIALRSDGIKEVTVSLDQNGEIQAHIGKKG